MSAALTVKFRRASTDITEALLHETIETREHMASLLPSKCSFPAEFHISTELDRNNIEITMARIILYTDYSNGCEYRHSIWT